jgi:hypothetical protein
MEVKQIIDEDFVNYKIPSMYIGFPKCSFKCEKECGKRVCQNGVLAASPTIDIDIDNIVSRYMSNFITSAIVIAGLEPFDSYDDLFSLMQSFRKHTDDDIVIYTGFYKGEILDQINQIINLKNIVIKFGRYIPDQEKHYDDILGVYLASDNQYAERIS